MSGVKQSSGCSAVLGWLEKPAWNGPAGSARGEPGGAAAVGVAGLVFWGSHSALWSCHLLNSVSPALGLGEQLCSHSGYSRLSGFCHQYLGCDGVWMERLDGMDSED